MSTVFSNKVNTDFTENQICHKTTGVILKIPTVPHSKSNL